jgi:hypothetical protein
LLAVVVAHDPVYSYFHYSDTRSYYTIRHNLGYKMQTS